MEKKIIKLTYNLYLRGSEGEEELLLETANEQNPLVYCQGIGMMLPLFEANLEGKQSGEEFDFRLSAIDAYGEYDAEAVLTLGKDLFEIDGKFDEERVVVGHIVPMTTVDGQIVNAQVVEITNDHVTIDLNHPLAGEELHFTGRVVEVRDATDKEVAQLQQGCGGCKKGNCQSGCPSDSQSGCCCGNC